MKFAENKILSIQAPSSSHIDAVMDFFRVFSDPEEAEVIIDAIRIEDDHALNNFLSILEITENEWAKHCSSDVSHILVWR